MEERKGTACEFNVSRDKGYNPSIEADVLNVPACTSVRPV